MATFDEFPSLKELLAAAAEGNERAINALVARYNGLVYRYIRHYLRVKGCNDSYDHSEDIIGPAWFAILWHLNQLKDSEKFKPWVKSIISNLAYQHVFGHNGCRNRQRDTVQLEPTQNDRIESVENMIEAGVWVNQMVALAYKKSFMFGEIVRLHLVEGLTLEEVAEKLDQSYGRVRSFYYRNLLAFRKLFRNDDEGNDGGGSPYVN